METKTYTAPIEFKAEGEEGEFKAVFATLNVIDHDMDVTLPGAFGEQRVLIEPWNHDYSRPPVGKGMVHEEEDEALVDGKFFLDTESGREHHAVVKNLADMQEWSYTFQVMDAEQGTFDGEQVRLLKKLDVVGVSPVTRGAGIGTRTTTIKRAKDASEGAGDTGDGDEGEAGDGKPSGAPPRVLMAEIDIELVEVEK